MKSLFNLDSPVMQFLNKVADLVILNILWLVLCLPVVTIGASTTAMYRVTLNMIRDQGGGVAKEFFRAFRSNFKPATLIWLILLVPSAVVVMNLWLVLGSGIESSIWTKALSFLPAVVLAGISAYVFAYVAIFENTIFNTLKNSALLSIANLPKTILMVALNFLPLIVLVASPEFFLRSSIFWLLLGCAVVAYFNSMLLWGVFKKLIPDPDKG